ncbi:MAG: Glu/Leu/Phe/Val dehydrogenase dimerization domain-containing protein, partial [Desulfobacteria bacterium]
MSDILNREPELIVGYTDPVEGFKGWLVIDALSHKLCAGGLRVQKGLTQDRVIDLARNMTLKMRISGIRADGAKSGIDYDPTSGHLFMVDDRDEVSKIDIVYETDT